MIVRSPRNRRRDEGIARSLRVARLDPDGSSITLK